MPGGMCLGVTRWRIAGKSVGECTAQKKKAGACDSGLFGVRRENLN